MKTIYVYILKCSDTSYYIGVTNDLDRRLIEHNEGINKDSYTFSRRPLKLEYYEIFSDPALAIQFEKKLKKWAKRKKEAFIMQNWNRLKELFKCTNESNWIIQKEKNKNADTSTTLSVTP